MYCEVAFVLSRRRSSHAPSCISKDRNAFYEYASVLAGYTNISLRISLLLAYRNIHCRIIKRALTVGYASGRRRKCRQRTRNEPMFIEILEKMYNCFVDVLPRHKNLFVTVGTGKRNFRMGVLDFKREGSR